MEPENQDLEALRRSIVFPEEMAALKPQIFDSELKATAAALAHHLNRGVDDADLARVSFKEVTGIAGNFLFFEGECIGLVGRYGMRTNPAIYIFTPPPPDDSPLNPDSEG